MISEKSRFRWDDKSLGAQAKYVEPMSGKEPLFIGPRHGADQNPRTENGTSLRGNKNVEGLVVIGKGTSIVGEISNCSQIEIAGNFEGDAVADAVIVCAGGHLKGSVRSERAEVHGTIEGQVQVREHLDIRSTGKVSGEVAYGRLSVADGGNLAGSIRAVHKSKSNRCTTSGLNREFVSMDMTLIR